MVWAGTNPLLAHPARVGVGGLDRGLKFLDILLEDVITPYAKTLGDIYILLCMAWFHGGTRYNITSHPNRSCGGSFGGDRDAEFD